MKERLGKDLDKHLFVFLLSLGIPFILYFNRSLDNNRLTSWRWVFDTLNLGEFGLWLFLALIAAWQFSRVTFYERSRPLVLFAAAYVAAAGFWSEPEIIVDSSRYFTQAKFLKLYGIGYFAEQWGKEIFAWTDLPLVPFLYGLVFKFLGEQRIFLQALNTLFYALTVVLTYQLGKSLWNEDTGFMGGLLLLGFPYLYTQVPLLLVDVPTMFFFMLATVACVTALKNGGPLRIVLAALALFLVFYVKYSTWMMLSLIPVIFIYFLYLKPAPTIKRGAALALSALLLTGTLFIIYKDILIPQLAFLMEYQKPGLKRWSESYISTFFFQVHPFITAAALFAFWSAIRKKDYRFILVGFTLLLFFVMQVKRIRYTIPAFPLLALAAAYGLEEIRNRRLIKHIVFSAVATSLLVALTGYLPLLKTLGVQNLQAAGRYLNLLPGASAEVVSLAGDQAVVNPATAVPVLDIYTTKKLIAEYDPPNPEALERVRESPLRFTWEFPLPGYYAPKAEASETDALVIITHEANQTLPADLEQKISGYAFREKFTRSSHIFQHQTFVTVYHK